MGLRELDEALSLAFFRATAADGTGQLAAYLIGALTVYAVPLYLLYLLVFRPTLRVVAGKLLLGSLLAWQVLSNLVGVIAYGLYGFRERPFATDGYQELFFEQPAKSFPSDHAAFLLSISLMLLFYGERRAGWWFLTATIVSSLARVAVGFHYLGDIIAGWLLALLAVGLMRALDRPLTRLLGRVFRSLKLIGNGQ